MHESKNLKAHITKGRGSFITKLLEIMKVGFLFLFRNIPTRLVGLLTVKGL